MTDPVISPDGKSYWDGSEWIPLKNKRPSLFNRLFGKKTDTGSSSHAKITGNIVEGDMIVDQRTSNHTTLETNNHTITHNSTVNHEQHITQVSTEDIVSAMVQALERNGLSGQSALAELTPSQEKEVEQVLEMSEQLASHGIEIDP